jgi:hypothetical protein
MEFMSLLATKAIGLSAFWAIRRYLLERSTALVVSRCFMSCVSCTL